jgi:hypothetical protein
VWKKAAQNPRNHSLIRKPGIPVRKKPVGKPPSPPSGNPINATVRPSPSGPLPAPVLAQFLTFSALGLVAWLIASAYPMLEQHFQKRRLQIAERYKSEEPALVAEPKPENEKVVEAVLPPPPAKSPDSTNPPRSAPKPPTPAPPKSPPAITQPKALAKKPVQDIGDLKKTNGTPSVKAAANPKAPANQEQVPAKMADASPAQKAQKNATKPEPVVATAQDPTVKPASALPKPSVPNAADSKNFMGPPAPSAMQINTAPTHSLQKADVALNPQTGLLELRMQDGSVHFLQTQTPAAMPEPATPPTKPSAYTGRPPPAQMPMTALLPATPPDQLQFASPEALLQAMGKERPRLIYSLESWSRQQALVQGDPAGRELLSSLEEAGKNLLAEPPLQRVFGTAHARNLGDETLGRVFTLGCLHYLGNPNTSYAARGKAELLSLCDPTRFPDWGKGQNLWKTLMAGCLAYDWFAGSLDESSKKTVQATLRDKGLSPLLAEIKNMSRDALTGHGGVLACTTVLIFSLTFHDELPTEVNAVFENALKKWTEGLVALSPDGLCPEGIMSGEEVLFYSIPVLQSLISHKAPTNVDLFEGLAKTHLSRFMKTGPHGHAAAELFFTTPRESLLSPVSTWLSGRYGNPGYPGLTTATKTSFATAHLGTAGNLLYFNAWAATDGVPPHEMSFHWQKSASMILRTDWKPEGLAVGFTGMPPGLHPFLAGMGGFTLSCCDIEWGVNLGRLATHTGLDLRQSGYTASAGAYNTLWSGVEFDAQDSARFVESEFTDEHALAILQYQMQNRRRIRSWQRGLFVQKPAKGDDHNGFFLVQDEIHNRDAIDWIWQMHTRAEVRIRGREAFLEQEGQSMLAVLLSPADARFSVEEAPSQKPPLPSLAGYRSLQIRMPELKGRQTFTVAFYPSLKMAPKSVPTVITPLEKWIPKN